jgi:hypothetical protein
MARRCAGPVQALHLRRGSAGIIGARPNGLFDQFEECVALPARGYSARPNGPFGLARILGRVGRA